MPEAKRQTHLETKYWPYIVRYICECGDEVLFIGKEKPARLIKCWECLEKMIGF